MVFVPVLLIEKLILPAGALVALISQLVSAAFTVIGPGAPGADDDGAVLVQPASATAAMARGAPTSAGDAAGHARSPSAVLAGTGALARWGRRNSVSTTAT